MLAEGGAATSPPAVWTPEHLLLAALSRCTVKSLQHHAGRVDVTVEATANVWGTVTRPDGESRFRLIEARCQLDVRLEPLPENDALVALLERAEHDCFVGASLNAVVTYEWVVNGSTHTVSNR